MKIEVYPSLLEANVFFTILHSALIRNLMNLKGTVKLTAQGERVCLKDSKYILFEILANRTSIFHILGLGLFYEILLKTIKTH